MVVKIEDYLQSLPKSIILGEDVQLPDHSLREIFKFVDLNENDIFYHLGCGSGNAIKIALEEFHVKKAVGIDNDEEKISQAKELVQKNDLKNSEIICEDIVNSSMDDATVVLFWFTDPKIISTMAEKFSNLKKDTKVVTIWGPLPGNLPDKVDFPYILNQVPFKKARDLKEQLLAIFDKKCIDFVTAWEFAERYTKAIGIPQPENERFLNIIQSLIIWINAKNLGVACDGEMPPAIKNYIGILRNFFDLEVEHLLK